MVTEVREEQPVNAPSPILVSLFGDAAASETSTRALHAALPISLQFSRESYIVLLLSTTMEVREEQYANAHSPMLVTELGMVMEVRDEQLPNAQSSTLVTPSGIVMDVRDVQW